MRRCWGNIPKPIGGDFVTDRVPYARQPRMLCACVRLLSATPSFLEGGVVVDADYTQVLTKRPEESRRKRDHRSARVAIFRS